MRQPSSSISAYPDREADASCVMLTCPPQVKTCPDKAVAALPLTRNERLASPSGHSRRGGRSLLNRIQTTARNWVETLPWVTDFRIIFERDPAARNWVEVLLCYPGLHAIALHRVAHHLHHHRLPVVPRLISHIARFLTGIEIHPGATLGRGVFIDHGMGVVIGETAIVGDYTLIYQGVTLGGTGKETGKRHPTIGSHVVVGAGAKVLGNIQVGDYARIGAGSIVLRHVPAHCTAVGVPGRNICRSNTARAPLDHNRLPDAEAQLIRSLVDRIETLEAQIKSLSSS